MRILNYVGFVILAFVISSTSACKDKSENNIPLKSVATSAAITIQKRGEEFAFVNVSGKRFFSIGVNHLFLHFWTFPQNQAAIERRYNWRSSQGADALIKHILKDLKDMNFNSLGMHNDHRILQQASKDAYVIVPLGLQSDVYRMTAADGGVWNKWPPDIFSDDFESGVRAQVKKIHLSKLNLSNVIGYASTDILSWSPSKKYEGRYADADIISPWFEGFRRMPHSSESKEKLLEYFQTTYESVGMFNGAYGTTVNSWKELGSLRVWPAVKDRERVIRDNKNILEIVAEHWYGTIARIVREEDPGRLFLGDKLNAQYLVTSEQWLLPILKKHLQVLYVQLYRSPGQQVKIFKELHALSGMPILQGDVGGTVKKRGDRRLKGIAFESYEEVGAFYSSMVNSLASLPFMLGVHHCGFIDEDGTVAKSERWGLERGFFDIKARPHTHFYDAAVEANLAALAAR